MRKISCNIFTFESSACVSFVDEEIAVIIVEQITDSISILIFFPNIFESFYKSTLNFFFSMLALNHMRQYCKLNLRILMQLDLFTKTAEMARLYGIQVSPK